VQVDQRRRPGNSAARRRWSESIKAKNLACHVTQILPVPEELSAARASSLAESSACPAESSMVVLHHIPTILVGNIDFSVNLSHARVMTIYDRTERRWVDLLRVASSRCRLIAS
jgi:hypothetical protein